jgi:hypothetical protein
MAEILDTNDNANDFVINPPAPRNSASPPRDRIAPVPSMHALPAFQTVTQINVSWSASDPSGIADYRLRLRSATSKTAFGSYTESDMGLATQTSINFPTDTSVCFSVRAEDGALNTGPFSPNKCTSTPIDDSALAAHTFTRKAGSAYYNGTYSVSIAAGSSLTSAAITFKRLALLVTTCPSCGSVDIKWKGSVIYTVSLHSAITKHKVVVPILTFGTAQTGVVSIVTKSSSRVEIDGLGDRRT